MRMFTVVVSAFLCLTACSSRTERTLRDRVADKEVNTMHTKGTTEVLKQYRLPDVRPAKDPKRLVGRGADHTSGRAKGSQGK